MKFILMAVLATLMGCAATVPKTQHDLLLKAHDELNTRCITTERELRQDLDKWKPSKREIEENEEAIKSLVRVLNTKKFAQFMSNSRNEKVEVKADEIGFIDGYSGAIVRMWLRFPDALGKYYLVFFRDENDRWNYQGYFQIGVIPLTGAR